MPNELYRDVVFQVEEVLGNATSASVKPGPISFTTIGGKRS